MSATYVTLMGGLGNQLFQYAAAVDSGSDQIILVPEIGSPRKTNGIEDIFAYKLKGGTRRFQINNPSRLLKKVFNFILKINLNETSRNLSTLIVNTANLFFSGLLTLWLKERVTFAPGKGVGYTVIPKSFGESIYLHGYFQSATYMQQPKTYDSMKSLTLSNSPNWLSEYTTAALEHKPIIVHVRRGDYRSESNFGLLGPEYYRLALSFLKEQIEITKIWLFSDEPDYAFKLVPEELQAMVDVIPVFDDRPALTLELMRLGGAYVIANSSFSWWAAMLSRNAEAIVVAPKQWFKNQESPVGLIPEHWKSIESNFL